MRYNQTERKVRMENICKFVSTRTVREEINIIHFVYEKNAQFEPRFILPSTYSVAFVTQGEGRLHTASGTHDISSGDFFVIFSAQAYYIENVRDLNYIYVTFIGSRAPTLMERLQLAHRAPVYHDYAFLRDLWETSFDKVTEENIDMMCEGLLLYTLSFICRDKEESTAAESANGILLVKQYVDTYFTDAELSLSTVSMRFSYNTKYLSGAFKKMLRVSFTEYLTEKRLNYAASMIGNGISNVSDLAEMCGYADAMYFSKVFKKKYGVSPKQYMQKEQ